MMFDYARNGLLNLYLNGTPGVTLLSQVALLTQMPEPSGGSSIVEPSGGAYARVSTGTNWSTPINGRCYNTIPVAFPKATASWGVIVGLAIVASDGPVFYGPLRSPIIINAVSPPLVIPVGAITVGVDGCAGQTVQNAMLTAFLKQIIPSPPSNYYLGLSSVLPENDGTGWTEPTLGSNGYNRSSIANGTDWKNPVTAGLGYNGNTISIPMTGSPTGAWGTSPLVAWGLWGSPTSVDGSSDLYFFGRLHTPTIVSSGSPTVSFLPGQIEIGVDLACC